MPQTATSLDLVVLPDRAAVLAAIDDPYPRADLRDDVEVVGWATDGAVAWAAADAFHHGEPYVSALGDLDATAQMIGVLLTEGVVRPAGLRVLRGVFERLPETVRPATWTDWDWWWTATPPQVQPHEDRVELLDGSDTDEVAAFLARSSPTASVEAGSSGVHRWVGIRERGRIVATAADARYVADVPHLAAIATDPEHRGQGYGAAVTTAISRRAFDEGAEMVTLGMYAWNDTARSLYRRLGFEDRHHWSSTRLDGSTDPHPGDCG